jgi:hypothetical protein
MRTAPLVEARAPAPPQSFDSACRLTYSKRLRRRCLRPSARGCGHKPARAEDAVMSDSIRLDDLKVDADNLYKEEVFSDLRVATIRKLTPIRTDGSTDETRQVMFSVETQILTPQGLVPVHAPVEATTLAEVIERFPAAIQAGLDRMIEEAREMRRQSANRIVTPQEVGGGKLIY